MLQSHAFSYRRLKATEICILFGKHAIQPAVHDYKEPELQLELLT